MLTNAYLLSYGEFLGHIANVKLGALLGLLPITDIEALDDLIVSVRPASLCLQYGKEISQKNRDIHAKSGKYSKSRGWKIKKIKGVKYVLRSIFK